MAAFYLAALLSETAAPGAADGIVTRVALQQAASGEPLDDLIVDASTPAGGSLRLSLQVKSQITISAAQSNADFREIVRAAAATVEKPGFRVGVDRVGLVTGTVAAEPQRALLSVCALARGSDSYSRFRDTLFTPGVADERRRAVFTAFSTILQDAGCGGPEEAAFELLRHFVLIEMDLLHPGATGDAAAVAALAQALRPDAAPSAPELWARLGRIAREAATAAAVIDRPSLVTRLSGAYRLVGARSLRRTLRLIEEEAQRALAEIPNEVGGKTYPRVEPLGRAAASTAVVTHLAGPPGAGKSAVLRSLVETALGHGPTLFLKSDRLLGTNWRSYATQMGLDDAPLADVLVELCATGSGTIFIDGVDRVEIENRGLVRDVLTTVLEMHDRAGLRAVLTVRGNELEPLQNWLPERLLTGNGTAVVDIGAFTDEECRAIAADVPALHPLLFGARKVREIARRPFFTAVLARSVRSPTAAAPVSVSEVDLAMLWWEGGGLFSEGAQRTRRQRTLMALARSGAVRLGRRMPIVDLDFEAVRDLCADGIIRETRAGHEVSFAHDIFFEWSFLQLLIGHGDDWTLEISRAGEPPALGRPVELLSQWALERREGWSERFKALERAKMRSQWQRAWLIGPFDSPRLPESETEVEALVFANGAVLLKRLVLWFQAERTRPNPMILAGAADRANLPPRARVRIADALAWPSELDAWTRFLGFLLRTQPRQPISSIPAVAEAFGVWQNLFRSPDLDSLISRQICAVVEGWLAIIEEWRYAASYKPVPDPWNSFPRGVVEELESKLRALLLTSGPREAPRIAAYLGRIKANRRLAHDTFEQLVVIAPLLVQQGHASLLREITLAACLGPLPEEIEAADRQRRDRFLHAFSHHDWHSLATDRLPGFHPASPIREPFKALFDGAPDQARQLVRQLTNHAIAAWRQLHQFDYERRGTPIPALIRWPWGDHYFWGDDQSFAWPRGVWGPPVVGTGLMALEAWALKELEKGRPPDDVIRDVVEGHEGNAVLSTAVLLSLTDGRGAPSAGSLLACQRVWRWEERRFRDDFSRSANLIGFMRPSDREHGDAVKALNELPARRLTMPSLAMMIVLRQDETSEAGRKAMGRFGEELPFDLEEERQVPQIVEALRKAAADRLPLGIPQNYRFEPLPESNLVQITFDDPLAQDPERQAKADEAREYLELTDIAIWASSAFDRHDPITREAYAERLAKAQAADRPDLFDAPHDESARTAMSAVASAAAACLVLASDLTEDDLHWCRATVLRAAAFPVDSADWHQPYMLPVFHPVELAARGVAGLAQRGLARAEDLDVLLTACVHPIEAVAKTAATVATNLCHQHPRLTWAALSIVVKRSILPARAFDPDEHGKGHVREKTRLEGILDEARRWLQDGAASFQPCPLPDPLAPPTEDDSYQRRRGRRAQTSSHLHYKFLAELLAKLPVEMLTAADELQGSFTQLLESLAAWTVASLQPAGGASQRRWRDDDRHSELMTWSGALYGCVARAALALPPEVARGTFLDPVLSLPDEAVELLMSSFVTGLSTRGVMDPQVPSQTALALLRLCAERTATNEQLRRQAYDREGLYGYYLGDLVRDLLFVRFDGASGAARFANDDYSELPLIMPIVEVLAGAAARSRTGLDAYLTLCERSAAYFPAAFFVSLILDLMGPERVAPLGWLGTLIPGRIAALIHDLAERDTPLSPALSRDMLTILDALVDIGDRRSAALQLSQIFREVRAA